jgi:hypothetical protein
MLSNEYMTGEDMQNIFIDGNFFHAWIYMKASKKTVFTKEKYQKGVLF